MIADRKAIKILKVGQKVKLYKMFVFSIYYKIILAISKTQLQVKYMKIYEIYVHLLPGINLQ